MTYDHDGIGFAELFDVEPNARGYLELAKRYLAEGNAKRAQSFLALSFSERAREQSAAKGV